MIEIEEKVSRLEEVLEQFITQTNYSINSLHHEMSEFKNEMSEFKGEMSEFKYQINKKWSELAQKMGTVVEDIIVPGCESALSRKFKIKINSIVDRMKLKNTYGMEEFDIIVEGSDGKVYMVEVKSTLRIAHIRETIEKAEVLKKLKYRDLEIVPILSSLNINESILRHAGKSGVYILGMKGDYLEILN